MNTAEAQAPPAGATAPSPVADEAASAQSVAATSARAGGDGLALVVGGSSGIGMDAARRLLQRGVSVLLVARNADKLEDAARQLSPHAAAGTGAGVSTRALDLRDAAAVRAAAAEIEAGPALRYVVNAAGVFSPKPFVEHTEEDYDAYHDINRATLFLTQAAERNMVAAAARW